MDPPRKVFTHLQAFWVVAQFRRWQLFVSFVDPSPEGSGWVPA
jgi:hypothetical protein